MADSEKFSNNSPDLQDAIRSIEATGEDSGAISGEGSEAKPHGETTASSTVDTTDGPFDAESETDTTR